MKIVCMEPLGVSGELLEQLAAPLGEAGHQFIAYHSRETDPQLLQERVRDAEILVLANQPLGAAVLSACHSLRYVDIGFTGVDHVDLAWCKAHGVQASNCAGYSTAAVAELTLAMILSLYRQLPRMEQAARSGQDRQGCFGRELRGKTLGLIGCGAIGQQVARIGQACGCQVIAWSRSQRPEVMAMGVSYRSLEQVLAESDILSLHVPATAATRNLIGREQLALMKPNAILINTARGAVLDSAALAQALNNGRLAGAACDVFESEPPLAADHPLLQAKNFLPLPHVGFATEEAMIDRAHILFDNIRAWLGGAPENLVC